jgi:hypothetical protein
MLDLKASAVTEVTAGVFVFQRVAYVVPRFSLGTGSLMSAPVRTSIGHHAKERHRPDHDLTG